MHAVDWCNIPCRFRGWSAREHWRDEESWDTAAPAEIEKMTVLSRNFAARLGRLVQAFLLVFFSFSLRMILRESDANATRERKTVVRRRCPCSACLTTSSAREHFVCSVRIFFASKLHTISFPEKTAPV